MIADGGSTDATPGLLASCAADRALLSVVTGPGPIAENRNAAIRAAESQIIACTDAGCVPELEWLERLTEPFADRRRVGGRVLPARWAPAASTAAGAVMMTTEAEVDLDNFLPGGSSQAFRRSVWERAGGFPEGHGVGEDTLFGERLRALGYKPVFVPDAVVAWQPPTDLRAMADKAWSWGQADGTNQVRTGAYAKVLSRLLVLPGPDRRCRRSKSVARGLLACSSTWRSLRIAPDTNSRRAGWTASSGCPWRTSASRWRRVQVGSAAMAGAVWFAKSCSDSGPARKFLVAGTTRPVRHNVDVLVRSASEARHWLSFLPTDAIASARVPPDPHVALVTATMTPASGEPLVAPVTVEYGPKAVSLIDDPVARYEHLRQTGRRYQLTPSPGGVAHRADLIETPIAAVVLAAVPLHDVGGGSRGAQLALEMAMRGIHVTYVHRFDAAETVDLGLRFVHPLPEERRFDEFEVVVVSHPSPFAEQVRAGRVPRWWTRGQRRNAERPRGV